jgi:uncharacterized protein (DUF1800 family)
LTLIYLYELFPTLLAPWRYEMLGSLKRFGLFVVLVSPFYLSGCSVGKTPNSQATTTSSGQQKTVSISVGVIISSDITVGESAQYTAAVTGSENTSINWAVNSIVSGNSTFGTITPTGLYTAPTTVPTQNQITITATSAADPTQSADIDIQVLDPVPIISRVVATHTTNGSLSLDVTGNAFMAGAVVQAAGTNLMTYFVSGGEMTATIPNPPSPGSSLPIIVVNPSPGTTQSATWNVSIANPISVSITGSSTATVAQSTKYMAVVTGSSTTSVTWSVDQIVGGNMTCGTISAAGSYLAPTQVPVQNLVTVTATSVADPTQSASMQVAIDNSVPVVSSGTAAYAGDGSVLLDLLGSNFLSTAVVQVNGSVLATAYVSPTEVRASLPSPPTSGSQVQVAVMNPNPGSTISSPYSVWVPASVSAAARLLDQTTFGATDAEIAHVQAIGLSAYIDEQLSESASLMPDLPKPLPTRCATFAVLCDEENWFQNALYGNDQLRQRVSFTLSQMFVISYLEVDGNAFPPYINGLTNDSFGNWSKIMKDVTLSPGMGIYLNMVNSGKAPVGQIANENFARENMQLFNTGIVMLNNDGTNQLDSNGQSIPVYSEAQVEAFARAFTGWTFATSGTQIPGRFPNNQANYDSLLVPVDSAHDTSTKVLLNTTLLGGQTAEQDLDGALADVFNHTNVGPFVCKQLIQHLVKSNPTPQYVARVAAIFANNGSGVRGDMPSVLKAILLDAEARAGDTTANIADGHLREPTLWTLNVMRALSAVPAPGVTDGSAYDTLVYSDTNALGESVFRPASVFNFYPPDYAVLNTGMLGPEFALETTGTSMERLTVADHIVSGQNSTLSVNLSSTSPLGLLANSTPALLDELNKLFMHGQMSSQLRTTILNTINPLNDSGQRVRVAVYLVITSSQYKIAH